MGISPPPLCTRKCDLGRFSAIIKLPQSISGFTVISCRLAQRNKIFRAILSDIILTLIPFIRGNITQGGGYFYRRCSGACVRVRLHFHFLFAAKGEEDHAGVS